MFGIFKKVGKAAKKSVKKIGGKKKPFGGFSIKFDGRKETLEQVFGRGAVTPSEMTKKLWKFIKSRKLGSR